ncbi:hypothetical protein SLEP1_g20285 [Rubroshorea leprosula]|uniref:3-dehydroquinate synthase n=1 Tax=Rubroshorea leprosula TaxID=152421 RepID=A0AAV5J882_9ROSI|nr:hypothetical protein SLEP1_g20285 [Rubroshorea leprosula]
MALSSSATASFNRIQKEIHCFPPKRDKWNLCNVLSKKAKGSHCRYRVCIKMSSFSDSDLHESLTPYEQSKRVWVWTESKQVMTAAVERGWKTFLFTSHNQELAHEWSSMAFIDPLFIKEGGVFDGENKRVATVHEISTPEELKKLRPEDQHAANVVIDLQDWQVIPAENIVAEFQGSQKTVFAVSKCPSEAQLFLEALEHGLGGVVLKVEDVEGVLDLKEYFDRRNEGCNRLSLTKATVTRVDVAGMGDRVCVDLCSLMRPGLFLVHSECLESNYIASRPFRVNAGPVHAYVAIPGGKTCYLSELKAGNEVIVVNQKGKLRTEIVGRVKIETRPLILLEAKMIKLYTASFYRMQKLLHWFVPSKEMNDKRQPFPLPHLKLEMKLCLEYKVGLGILALKSKSLLSKIEQVVTLQV